MRNNKELNNIIAEAVNEGFKDIIKKGVKKVGSAIKQEWDELNDIDKIMSAPNPMYLGDPEDIEDLGDYDVDESLRRFIKESVRQALNGCLKENRDYDWGQYSN